MNQLKALFLFILLACSLNITAQRIKGSDTVLPVSQETAEIFMKDDPDRRVTVTGGGNRSGDFRPDGQHNRYRYGFPSHQIQRKDETESRQTGSGGGNHSV